MITIVVHLFDRKVVFMLEVKIFVDAPMKDAVGVKELVAMAMEQVPGVVCVRVMGVQP